MVVLFIIVEEIWQQNLTKSGAARNFVVLVCYLMRF